MDSKAYINSIGGQTWAGGVDLQEDIEEEEEGELVWWEFGSMFGITMPALISMAIADCTQSAAGVLPLPDVPEAKLEQPHDGGQQAAGSICAGQIVAKAEEDAPGHGYASASSSRKEFSLADKDWLAMQIFTVNEGEMLQKGKAPRPALVRGIINDALAHNILPGPAECGCDEGQYERKVTWVLRNHRPEKLTGSEL